MTQKCIVCFVYLQLKTPKFVFIFYFFIKQNTVVGLVGIDLFHTEVLSLDNLSN